mmetsp:Transcript_62759/g.163068  ORF Transcript_62759/g.163068 Transcript_62759/m.163068 type:complete len:367 (+) Transcript_62759:659-1759(+)
MFACWQPTKVCVGPHASFMRPVLHGSRSDRTMMAATSQPLASWHSTTSGSPPPIRATLPPPLHSLLRKRKSVRIPKSAWKLSVGRRLTLMTAVWLSISTPAPWPSKLPAEPTNAQLLKSRSWKPSCLTISITPTSRSNPSPLGGGSGLAGLFAAAPKVQRSRASLSTHLDGSTHARWKHSVCSSPLLTITPSQSGFCWQSTKHSSRATMGAASSSASCLAGRRSAGISALPCPAQQFLLSCSSQPALRVILSTRSRTEPYSQVSEALSLAHEETVSCPRKLHGPCGLPASTTTPSQNSSAWHCIMQSSKERLVPLLSPASPFGNRPLPLPVEQLTPESFSQPPSFAISPAGVLLSARSSLGSRSPL